MINNDDTKLKLPSQEEIQVFKNTISEKYPVLENVWGAVDGLKLNVQESGNFYIQNHFYNGWTYGHYINSLFAFAANGNICICVLNAPGTFYDYYDGIDSVWHSRKNFVGNWWKSGGNLCFQARYSRFSSEIITICWRWEPQRYRDDTADTSMRQLSEWGMRMIEVQPPTAKGPSSNSNLHRAQDYPLSDSSSF